MIVCKSQAELEKMHRAGLVIWEVLNHLRGMARPGVTTKELDEYAERRTSELKVRPAFKNYRGYPAALCTSINSEVVHGIPSKLRRLEQGDIISLDFGVEYAGYYGEPGRGLRLQEGMVFAIEPMVNVGGPDVRVLEDDWTAVTTDGTKSAHFEHTVAVTSDGPWVLTRPREMQGPSW